MAELIKDKSKKETIQFIASLLVLLAGVVLVFISLFLQPVGVIHYTVITVFGMFLTFVGAVWQIDVKYEFKSRELEHRLVRRLADNEENQEI